MTTCIFTPTYNKPKRLLEAAESVFAQTYGNWHWLIALDGPTEETYEAAIDIYERARCDVELAIFSTTEEERKAKYRPSVIWNSLDVGVCDRVCWLSDDDLLRPKYLEKLNAKLDETGGDVSFCAVEYKKEIKNGFIGQTVTGLKDCYGPESNEDPCGTLDGGCILQTTRSVLPMVETWEDAWRADGLYMRELASKHKFHHVPYVLLTHRRCRESTHSRP